MGLFSRNDPEGKNLNDLSGVERLFIDLPDKYKGTLLFKWPDENIRKGSTLLVDIDYTAIFTYNGEIVGNFGPGKHKLEDGEGFVKGFFIDRLTDERSYEVSMYFIKSTDRTDVKFGGSLDSLQVPGLDLGVTFRAFGDFNYKVVDAGSLLKTVEGTDKGTEQDKLDELVKSQVLNALREKIQGIVKDDADVLSLGEHQAALEEAVVAEANSVLLRYGLALTTFGVLNVNLKDEDMQVIKDYLKSAKYVQLAGGSYTDYTMGEALKGMGANGGASGGGSDSSSMVALMMMQQLNAQKTTSAAPSGVFPNPVKCKNGHDNAVGSKFCNTCGSALTCTCGAPLTGKFCSNCGKDNG